MRDLPDGMHQLQELDLLIEPDHINKVLEILSLQGWVVYQRGFTINHKYVAVKVVDSRSYHLDIHCKLIQNDWIYLDNDWFFNHSVEFSDHLYQPGPVAYLYHLAMHVILGKKRLDEKYHARVKGLVLTQEDRESLLQQAAKYGIASVFSRVLQDPINSLGDPVLVKQFKKECVNALLRRDPGYLWRRVRKTVFRLLAPLFGRNRGVSIAFIGPDGAGKTTFITQLEQRLNELGLTTRNAYMGPWFRNKFFTTLMLDAIGANPEDEILGLDQVSQPLPRAYKKTKGLIRRYLFYFNTPLEVYYRYFRYVYLQSLRGRVVLLDRYIHDLEIGYRNKEVKNNIGLRRLITKLSPRPDLMVLLYNDPDTIWARKKEYSLEDIRWVMTQYLKVADRYNIEKIITDKECPILIDQFIERHWMDIYKKKADRRIFIDYDK